MNERSILSVLAGSSSTATVASQAVDEERGASAAAVHYPARHARVARDRSRWRPRSCPPTSAACASRSREVLDAGARVIHIDVMDGHFVPVITFGPKMVADIAGLIHEHGGFADVHLMIEQPERHIDQFAAAGADSITVHVETCPHLHSTLHAIRDAGLPGRRDAEPGDAGRGAGRGGPLRRRAAVHERQPRLGRPGVHPGHARAAAADARAGRGPVPDRCRSRSTAASAPPPSRTCVAAGANILVGRLGDLRRGRARRDAYRELAALVASPTRRVAWAVPTRPT